MLAHQAAGEVVFAHTAHTGGGNVTRWEVHNRPLSFWKQLNRQEKCFQTTSL
ncbi:hypothetical protein NEIMUCOT_05322 [Neisseria mucosa ATCC 25996]|uniref:Uncharacterized protein n=1 Tax=Neisseria mucosa (strain ATCC 25996 / DSM 4631 / NCTC 10774 / M26) TaxID=546266 RepID=D2ZXH0_NEIM2|nr:hypothetical protein NEIMUCOT_05322 [Neisseria mucosa ATCC 25996]